MIVTLQPSGGWRATISWQDKSSRQSHWWWNIKTIRFSRQGIFYIIERVQGRDRTCLFRCPYFVCHLECFVNDCLWTSHAQHKTVTWLYRSSSFKRFFFIKSKNGPDRDASHLRHILWNELWNSSQLRCIVGLRRVANPAMLRYLRRVWRNRALIVLLAVVAEWSSALDSSSDSWIDGESVQFLLMVPVFLIKTPNYNCFS